MKPESTPLPDNRAVLERLLTEADRAIDYLDPIVATQRFRAEQIERAADDTLQVLPMLPVLRSTTVELKKHTLLHGHTAGLLQDYLDQQALSEDFAKRTAAMNVLRVIARRPPTIPQEWKQAAAALGTIAACDAAVVKVFREVRQQIVAKLSQPDVERDPADRKPDKTGKKSAVKPIRLPRNHDVTELARLVQRGLQHGQSQIEVALGFTDGDRAKADSLLRQLRRYPHLLEG